MKKLKSLNSKKYEETQFSYQVNFKNAPSFKVNAINEAKAINTAVMFARSYLNTYKGLILSAKEQKEQIISIELKEPVTA